MQPNAIDTLPLAGSIAHDLSIIGLFLQSDAIVKLVMLILLLASFWSWAVIFDKAIRIRRLRHAASNFEENFWSGGSLDDLYERVGQRPPDPMAASKNTSLAVVAPGIAESLFATALGLVAAIPAVIAYNKLATDFGRYAGRLEAFASEFSAILSRQLDERP